MTVPPSVAWKLVLAAALIGTIVAAAYATAPRRAPAPTELRRLVLSALGLYAVGGISSFTSHPTLAAIVFASGVSTCALALWLSRGTDSGDDRPRGGEDPADEWPPEAPDGQPAIDFAQFERDFHAYVGRSREPVAR